MQCREGMPYPRLSGHCDGTDEVIMGLAACVQTATVCRRYDCFAHSANMGRAGINGRNRCTSDIAG